MPPIKPEDGPVAVTGASGFIGSWTVYSFLKRGYTVHACLRDAKDKAKTEHLLALNAIGVPSLHVGRSSKPGTVKIFEADLTKPGSYDEAFSGCCAVIHVGTAMGYGGVNNPRQVYDGAVSGTENVLSSVKKAGTVKRVVFTSSFAAIGHPVPNGYVYTEKDWASDGRQKDPLWNFDADGNLLKPREEDWEAISKVGDLAYSMAKVTTEKLVNRVGAEQGFESITICPCVVLGPLMSTAHELVGSWQWVMGRLLRNKPVVRGQHNLWNIVDVRDVAEAHALAAESMNCRNGARYQLTATDDSGELNVFQLQTKLMRLFPDIHIGGAPDDVKRVYDGPRAHCNLARAELGLRTHHIDDTLKTTGDTMLKLGLIKDVAYKKMSKL
eukprot:gnl/TRDRNA2_/TRDRNA2_192382_c0_seq1.p1 gnl/TRDRNA2_/TRDRNA2_192382_c0~~gnl/TRDRNA2_/TRDRNA2_192382_c0_seq1.p1  ORF type:complete len:383 (+),score=73.12 gnl/TRDRNA2_/TRDRNA2_192382_c0_seq1:62-1210(+)